MDIAKCPAHPNSSGESQYGGYYCWGADRKCKWAIKQFVNDTPDGGVEKVVKYHLPSPGKWLTKEDYISAVQQTDFRTATERETAALQDDSFPPDEGLPLGAPESPSESPVDRQTSIVRQTCIKAAGMALQHNMGNAEEKAGQLTYLAGVLEDWVNR